MTQSQILELAIDGAYGKLAKLSVEIERGEKIYEEHANLVDGHITRARVQEVLKGLREEAKELQEQISEMQWMLATQE